VGAALGFAAVTPYFFLDFETALANLQSENRSVNLGADSLSPAGNLLWYLGDSLPANLTWPVGLLTLAGLALLLWRRQWLPLVLVAWAALFVVGLSASALHWHRWTIQLLPLLVLIAAYALVEGVQWVSRRQGSSAWQWGVLALGVALISAQPLAQVAVHTLQQQPDRNVRLQARAWVVSHLPAGSRVAADEWTLPVAGGPYSVDPILRLETRNVGYYLTRGCDDGQPCQYAVVASRQFEAYLGSPERYPRQATFYQEVFNRGTLLAEIQPFAYEALAWPWSEGLTCNCFLSPTAHETTLRIYQLPTAADDEVVEGESRRRDRGSRAESNTPDEREDASSSTAVAVTPTTVPSLPERMAGETLEQYEQRLRDLAARDEIPSGPSGAFIRDAVERARQAEAQRTP
jgi:hypothetical protein